MPTIVIRSRLARVAAGFVWTAFVTFLAMLVRADGLASWPFFAWGGLLALAVWGLWWAPNIVLSAEGLEVNNALRRYRIGWDHLAGVTGKWTLDLILKGGAVVRASGAPRRGGLYQSFAEVREVSRVRDQQKAGVPVTRRERKSCVRQGVLDSQEETLYFSLDAADAGDLIQAYQERQADLEKLRKHDAKRAARIAAKRGGAASPTDEASTLTVESRWNYLVIVLGVLFGLASLVTFFS